MEYEENKRQERAQYQQARNWQDVWHAFTHALARIWLKLMACFLCSPIKNHLTKEAVSLLPMLAGVVADVSYATVLLAVVAVMGVKMLLAPPCSYLLSN